MLTGHILLPCCHPLLYIAIYFSYRIVSNRIVKVTEEVVLDSLD